MVAKINWDASLYGVFIYNQQKVNKDATGIIYENRMITDVTGNGNKIIQQTMLSFENYLPVNKNTEKPVLHISPEPVTRRLPCRISSSPILSVTIWNAT
jgi:hypothetical protein